MQAGKGLDVDSLGCPVDSLGCPVDYYKGGPCMMTRLIFLQRKNERKNIPFVWVLVSCCNLTMDSWTLFFYDFFGALPRMINVVYRSTTFDSPLVQTNFSHIWNLNWQTLFVLFCKHSPFFFCLGQIYVFFSFFFPKHFFNWFLKVWILSWKLNFLALPFPFDMSNVPLFTICYKVVCAFCSTLIYLLFS